MNIDGSDVAIVTTAGDLLTATAANAPARFPITATAGGVSWAATATAHLLAATAVGDHADPTCTHLGIQGRHSGLGRQLRQPSGPVVEHLTRLRYNESRRVRSQPTGITGRA